MPVDPSPFQLPTDWSSDGRWIFFQTAGGGGYAEIWVASAADRKITRLVSSDSAFPALSPNRDYLAFSSTESGRSEVYAQRFLDDAVPKLVGERLRISHEGGSVPRWRRDGKELFFLSPDPERLIMAAAVKAGKGRDIEFGPPAALFRVPSSAFATGSAVYEVSPDGRKFLVPVRKTSSPPLQIVINWQQGLKQ
jgi:dipeptidyl aminopeptidase/acylaminoacyl peptidase